MFQSQPIADDDRQDNTLSKDGINIEKISKLVSLITADKDGNRDFDIPEDKNRSNTIKLDKVLNDQSRPLKDVATRFVVDEMFKSETVLYRFMRLVYNTFNEALKIYRNVYDIKSNYIFSWSWFGCSRINGAY